METYPRRIVLHNEKLTKLLKEKTEMILEGRKISEDIDVLQEEMDSVDKEVQAVEATVQTEDLKAEAEELTVEFNSVMSKMEDNQKRLRERMIAVVPQELRDKYEQKKQKKEELERERNKIALKAQKWNDKIIPLGRKLMSPFIEDEFEDYDTIRFENGEVVATLFSHIDDFKKNFRKKRK
jgi:uncharacterized protein YoxC